MDTGLGHLSFGLFWVPISESGVDPPPVIVALYIREQVASGFLAGRPSPLVRELDLQRVEEAFHGGIVVAAPVRLIDGFAFMVATCLAYTSDAYWLPQSE